METQIKNDLIKEIISLQDQKTKTAKYFSWTPPTETELKALSVPELQKLKTDLEASINTASIHIDQKKYNRLNPQSISGFKDHKQNYKIQ